MNIWRSAWTSCLCQSEQHNHWLAVCEKLVTRIRKLCRALVSMYVFFQQCKIYCKKNHCYNKKKLNSNFLTWCVKFLSFIICCLRNLWTLTCDFRFNSYWSMWNCLCSQTLLVIFIFFFIYLLITCFLRKENTWHNFFFNIYLINRKVIEIIENKTFFKSPSAWIHCWSGWAHISRNVKLGVFYTSVWNGCRTSFLMKEK